MADEGEGIIKDSDFAARIGVLIIVLVLIAGIAGTVGNILNVDTSSFTGFFSSESFARFFATWKVIAVLLSLFFLATIFYSQWRINQIRKEEAHVLKLPSETAFTQEGERNERWEHVETLASSDNPSDWRQAVLEADIILDDLVTTMGYDGDGLGEKMKGIEQSDFTSINSAWEAHKVRNRIAHEGSDFILTERELRRIIALYEEVFKEFRII